MTRLSLVTAAVVFPVTLQATDYTWGVTGTSPWATATNWTPNGIPTADDTIAIGGTTATAVTLDSAKSVFSLSISNTGTTALSSAGGPFALTLGVGGLNIATGSGIATLGSTTAASNLPIILAGSQSWTSASTTTHLVRGSITGTDLNLTLAGNYDMRSHAGGTPVINLGTGILTQNSGNFEIGTGVHTIGGYVLKGGNVFARNTGNFGTTGTITLGDSAASTTAIALRLATGSGNWARPIVLNSGTTGTIYIDNLGTPNSPVLTGGITGTNNLTLQSTISGASGSVTFNTGAIDFTGALLLKNQGTGTVATAAGTVTINTPITDKVTTVTLQDVTTGTKGLQRTILGNTANAYTGNTTLNAPARLDLSASEVIPHGIGKGNVTVNGTLHLRTATGDSTETINGLNGSGTITRSGASGTSTLIVGANDASGTFTGPIAQTAGIVALTKIGSGTLALSGQNTYTGLTTVAGGTLTLDFPDMIADTSNLDVLTGATLNLTHGDTETVNSLRINGAPQATGKWGRTGSIAALGADFETSLITGDGLLDVTNVIADFYWDGTGTSWASAAAWTVTPTNAAFDPAVPPSVTEIARFGLSGLAVDQTVQLNGDQAALGMIFSNPVAHTLVGGDADHVLAIATSGITVDAVATGVTIGSATPGQKVDLALSGNQTWSNLSTLGPVTVKNGVDLGSALLTITGVGNTVLDGPLSGTGGLSKGGAGTLTLNADSTHNGTTTIPNNSGIVAISRGSALGTGTVNISRGGTSTGTLELSGDITVPNNFTLASATGFGGAGTSAQIRNVSGNNTLSGTLTLNATGGNGINLESVSGLLTVSNTVTSTIADNTRQLGLSGTGDGLVSGNIVNTGANQFSVIKSGTGTWTLSGTNAYTGSTTVNAGTLVLTNNGGIADTATVNVAADAFLRLDFTGSDTVGVLLLGGTTMGPGTYNSSHPSGRITGTGSLVVPNPDPFLGWIATPAFGLAAGDRDKTDDPDGDGMDNLLEFALDGNPASAAATGKVVSKIDGGFLTLTLPVRTGAVFTGTGPLTSAAISDLIYRIDGDNDLSGWTSGVEELIPALTDGLPAPLSTGWSYRTFRLTTSVTAASKGFLRIDASDAP